MTPTWYDLLGVEPDATADEIRAAWKTAIADLDPTDRRFRTFNEAAEVLLDEKRRSDYDASLEPEGKSPTEVAPPLTRPQRTGGAKRGRSSAGGSGETQAQSEARLPTHEAPESRSTRRRNKEAQRTEAQEQPAPPEQLKPRRVVPAWLLAVVAVLTAASLTVMGYLLQQPSDASIANATQDAQAAAERDAPVILAYDYRHLDDDQRAADALMTPEYRKEYDSLFETIQKNAPKVKPVVTASVVDSGIIRSGGDRVQILVLLNRTTTNADGVQPPTHDQVRVTMVKDGGDWLVDKMETQPLPQ